MIKKFKISRTDMYIVANFKGAMTSMQTTWFHGSAHLLVPLFGLEFGKDLTVHSLSCKKVTNPL
jgi:hypothetical protein